jgi:hypothetical protein
MNLLLLLLVSLFTPPEVRQVAADRERITITGRAAPGAVDLLEVAPNGTPTGAGAPVPARTGRDGRFRVTVPRLDGERDRLYSGWAARAGTGASAPRFPEPRGVSRDRRPYPRAGSKKGLQVQMVDDALTLGVKHAALNVDLARLPDLEKRADSHRWTLDGETFHVRRDVVAALDRQVKPLSDAGVLVTFILLTYEAGDPALRRIMNHPRYDPAAPNRLSAFNTLTDEGLKWYRALMEFLADRYAGANAEAGRVVGYIVGNEVNSHWWWSNMGPVSLEAFTEDYLRTLRVTWTAVRKQSAAARVYVSLEHHWNAIFGTDETRAFRAKAFLDLLARRTRETGPFDWHVAFHPYPEDLFEPRTWLDKTAEPRPETPRVTFKNLSVLTDYLRRPEMLHAGRPRRVILSEQGFHAPDRPDGERDQAAAYAYAYRQADRLPGIDAFILHRHVDHKREGGLKLGLWTWKEESPRPSDPNRQRLIYQVFKAADTPGWRQAFAFALPVIGIKDWRELLQPVR